MRLIAIVGMLSLLGGCVTASKGDPVSDSPYQGKRHWLQNEVACSSPGYFSDKSAANCQKSSGPFVTDRVVKVHDVVNQDFCHIKFDDGQEGWISCLTVSISPEKDPAVELKKSADAVVRAKGTFVLVFTGNTKASDRPSAEGACLISPGRGSHSESVYGKIPWARGFDADSISCAVKIDFGVGPIFVELRRGTATGEIVAKTRIDGTDIVSVAGR